MSHFASHVTSQALIACILATAMHSGSAFGAEDSSVPNFAPDSIAG